MDPLLSSRMLVVGYLFFTIVHASLPETELQWGPDTKRNHMTTNGNPEASKAVNSKYPLISYQLSRSRDEMFQEEIIPHISVISNVRNKSSASPTTATVNIAFNPNVHSSQKGKPKHHSALLSASSTMMDFNEDTRRYFSRHGMNPQKRQLLFPVEDEQFHQRHMPRQPYIVTSTEGLRSSHKNYDKKETEQKLMIETVSCNPCESQVSKAPAIPTKRRIRIRVPAKALMFANTTLHESRKSRNLNKVPNRLHNRGSHLSVHSPTRIYIPIKFHEENFSFGAAKQKNCVLCPKDQTLQPGRQETCVQAPVPSVSVCPFLAQIPGRVNVAITSGPSPGTMISEGMHPVELILWKKGGHVFYCQYTLTVKVNRCKSFIPPRRGSVECSNGTVWGSRCHFTCLQNYVLIGHHSITCEGSAHNLSWSSKTPKCRRKTRSLVESVHKLFCKRPDVPISGTVVCSKSNDDGLYSDGSVCQFFCFRGYNALIQSSTDLLSVCTNGYWSPLPDMTCVAAKCSKPPEPQHGTYKCKEVSSSVVSENGIPETKYVNGTICRLRCEIGYVIPTSQWSLIVIECIAPDWNTSIIPDCKRAIPPTHHPDDCHDEILLTDVGNKVQINLPRFTSSNGFPLTPVCSQPTLLSSGNHVNFCEVTDPELQITTICSYEIKIIEKITPVPHPKDCRNQTLWANRRGITVFKTPRFLSFGKEMNRTLESSCSYGGSLGIGTYINHCFAHDSHLNTTGHCAFTLTVKGVSCPKPPFISFGKVHCHPKSGSLLVYPPHAVCEYVCDEGYRLPTRYMKQRIWKCLPKLEWNKSILPICKKAIAPKPHHKDCQKKVFFLEKGKKIRLKSPRFQSSLKGVKVKVWCSLTEVHEIGNYTNFCEAKDVELRLNSTCTYDIIIKAMHCPPLSEVPNSQILCKYPSNSSENIVETVCQYVCHDDYTIPTSQLNHMAHHCTEHRKWNSTILPNCVSKIAPEPSSSSCLNEDIVTTNLSDVIWKTPEFVSHTGYLLNATCEPQLTLQYGYHNVTCIAHDPELRINGSCKFVINILEPNKTTEFEFDGRGLGCGVPELMVYGLTDCDNNLKAFYPVSTTCIYTCISGYAISENSRHLISIVCTNKLHWNSTTPPVCEEYPKLLDPGCPDLSVNVSQPLSADINIPHFITSRNTSASVTCSPNKVKEFGNHTIICKAYDSLHDVFSSCQYNLIVSEISEILELESISSSSQDTVAEFAIENVTNHKLIDVQCNSLHAPANGHLTCISNNGNDTCNIHCNPEFDFPPAYDFFRHGIVSCDHTDGLWDFQRMYDILDIPDCLGQLPMTSLRVWLRFEISVANCGDSQTLLQTEVQNILLNASAAVCEHVKCSEFQFQCVHDELEKQRTLKVTWVVEASFDPTDYEDIDQVPNVETQIEMVMENTQKMITTDQEMSKHLALFEGKLLQNSYMQSRFLFVCQKRGFVVDPKTDKCVHCPSGTMEVNYLCVSCPEDHYQEQTGQISCKPCPKGTHSVKGSRISSSCVG